MNKEDKENWESIFYRMDDEGFHYCFHGYSDWKEIKDDELHRLIGEYTKSAKNLKEYINSKYNESQGN